MLDRLPLELVELIVLLALPSPDSPLFYHDRQDTLRALCLTDRHGFTVAQPLLFKHVDLRWQIQLERFLEVVEGNSALGKAVRTLHIGHLDWEQGQGALSVALPTEVDNHKRLHIVGSMLAAQAAFLFPHVSELSLHNYHGVVDETFLRGVPAVHAFHLQMEDHNDLLPPPCETSLGLVRRVTAVVYDGGDLHPSGKYTALRLHDRVLVDAHFDGDFDFEDIRHLRLHQHALGASIKPFSPSFSNDEFHASELSDFGASILAGDSPRLSSLYLPSSLRPSPDSVPNNLSSSVSSLPVACTSRSIEVIFEPEPHPYLDSFISPTFLKRCEAIRAAEEAATACAVR
ncbi:hypothetical protein JCM10207_003469 [Rhodosporidiobolus poonsookiae]